MGAFRKWIRRHPEVLDYLEGYASVCDVYPEPVDLRRITLPAGRALARDWGLVSRDMVIAAKEADRRAIQR